MTDTALPSISLCFPVYNEEDTVGEVLREAHGLLSSSGLEYEIVVCDDGSTDKSRDIIEKISTQLPNFRVVNHPSNLGIRATFEDLYTASRKDFVFLNSVDKQWDTSILFSMLPLTKEYDIIIASRKKKPYDIARNFVSSVFNMIPPLLFGVKTFDAGAVKLVKREIVERFKLVSKSPFSEAERLIRASRAGYRIANYPVEVSARKTGKGMGVRPDVLLSACADVLRVWYSIHFKYEDI